MNSSFFSKLIYGGGIFFDLTKWFVVSILLLVVINTYWISIFFVDGISMEPNFHDGELALMNKTYFRGEKNPIRGEVVVVKYPGDPKNKRYLKRVIGLPGETLSIKNDRVYIDNELLKEPYLEYGLDLGDDESWILGKNQFFLMGDNREFSNDSRVFGVVEERFFIGKVTSVLVPRFVRVELPKYSQKMANQN